MIIIIFKLLYLGDWLSHFSDRPKRGIVATSVAHTPFFQPYAAVCHRSI